MIGSSNVASLTKARWQEVGAWRAGTVAAVDLYTVPLNSGTAKPGVTYGALASRAGVYAWTGSSGIVWPLRRGMSDLDVVSVALAGGTDTFPSAFAATASGRLFRTVLSGTVLSGTVLAEPAHAAEWQEVSTWAGLGVAVVLEPSPAYAEDQTLFVGTPTGIYRTQDDGRSWESCNFGLLDEDVLCLACAPNFATTEVLWAGTAGGGLYRSRNSGRAWRESGIGLPDAAVQSLAVSPNFAADRTVFVGVEGHGLYLSRDGGESWSYLALADHSVNSLACAEANTLWAGTEEGLSRVEVTGGATERMGRMEDVVMAVAAASSGAVAVGLFGSALLITGNGNGDAQSIEWQQPELALHAPPLVVRSATDLLALDADGTLARSEDNGATWAEMPNASDYGTFALDASVGGSESALVAATGEGLARWDAQQGQWQVVAVEPFVDDAALGIAVSSAFGNAPAMLATTLEGELQFSHDGTTWQPVTGPWQGESLLRALFSPNLTTEIVALTVQPTDTGHFGITVWRSVDLGQEWEVLAGLTTGVPAALIAWPRDEKEKALFLATQHRVIKLYTDRATGELQVHQHFFDDAVRVTGLAVSATYAENSIVWAATSAGFYRSLDAGMNWEFALELPDDLPVVWLDVNDVQVSAVTLGGRVWSAQL